MFEIITVNTPTALNRKFMVLEQTNRNNSEYLKGKLYLVKPNSDLVYIVRELQEAIFTDISIEIK